MLGVTGGIASYKAVGLARLLTQSGAAVDVVLTRGAQEFVSGITFEAVTGRRVYTDIFEPGHALDHIRLAREADGILIAPATADFVARAAEGRADDLLTAILLAATCPVMLAPAMNDRMWAHAQTQRNVARAREIGYTVLDPDTGPLAVGEGSGPGRLPEPDVILAHFTRSIARRASLANVHVVVTAGATREPLDPVRFISNRSSGRMGVALAAEAWRRGADVTLIAGHMEVAPPPGVRVIPIETTEDLERAVREALPTTEVFIMAAAPADFRPAQVTTQKIKKEQGIPTLTLEATPDVLRSTIPDRRAGAIVVGFALETENLVAHAQSKLHEKQLDLVIANPANEAGAGFGTDTNRVTIVAKDGAVETLPVMSKHEVAAQIFDRIEGLRHGR